MERLTLDIQPVFRIRSLGKAKKCVVLSLARSEKIITCPAWGNYNFFYSMTELLYNSEPLTIAASLFGVSERHRLTFNLNPSWQVNLHPSILADNLHPSSRSTFTLLGGQPPSLLVVSLLPLLDPSSPPPPPPPFLPVNLHPLLAVYPTPPPLSTP